MLEQAIAKISPKWALRRAYHRRILASYDAAKPSRLHKRSTDRGNGDRQVQQSRDRLTIQARDLERNLDIARGALNLIEDNVVSTGIRPEPQTRKIDGTPHNEFNNDLMNWWEKWIKCPDVTGDRDYYSMQRLNARMLSRDGEFFQHHLIGNVPNLKHHCQIPYSLEQLESDFIPIDYYDDSKNIIQGIQKDDWGKPTFYYAYKKHPFGVGGIGSGSSLISQDLKRIPAANMTHAKLADRVKQTRGVSFFASVINRLDHIKESETSELVAARVAANMTAYIKKGSPTEFEPEEYDTDSGLREMEFAAGMIFDDLRVGEDIGTIDSNRPNNNLIDFLDSQIRRYASGVGLGFSSLNKKYGGNFSSQRQELVEQYQHFGVLWHYFSEKESRPVWENFIKAGVLSVIKIPKDLDLSTLFDVDHSRPGMVWIDPVKEIKAKIMAIEAELLSRSQAMRASGQNPAKTKLMIEQEKNESLKPTAQLIRDHGDLMRMMQYKLEN